MLYTNAPSFIPVVWGASAGSPYIRTVPVASQIGVVPGAASFTDGFVPLNATNVLAGGIPPSVQDMNGVLHAFSANIQWQQAGGWYQFNSAFATAIGGYPNKACLLNATGTGFWFNTVDNNSTNPDSGGTGWQAVGASSCPWSGLTGSAPNISTFTNNVGYVTAAGASSAAPVQTVNGLAGAVTIPTGLAVNAIGYTVLYIVPGGSPVGSEGSYTTLSGRPGTWMNASNGGGGNLSSDQITLLVRVA